MKRYPDKAPLLATLSCLANLLESWPRNVRQSLERRRMTRCLTMSHRIKISQTMRSRGHRSQAGASQALWTKQGSKLRPRRSKNRRIETKAKKRTKKVRRRKLVQMAARMREMKIFMTTISRLVVTKMTMAERMVRIMQKM